MFKMYKRILLFLIVLFLSHQNYGQSVTDFLEAGLEENDIAQKLPPLDSLIAWARENNPYLKSFDSAKELGEGKVALEKRSWLEYISLDAGYGYGIYDNLSNSQIGGDPSSQTLFTSEQNRYSVGASVKMPLSAILNRKRMVKNTKLEAETFKYEQQQAENELRLQVTEQYNELIKFYRLLFINNSIVDTYKAQTVRAEREFADGIMNVTDYTRLLQMINQAKMALEAQKSEFYKAFMTLESTVGVDLKI